MVGTAAGAVGCPHCPVAATSDTDLSCWFLQKIVFFISFCNFVRALERLLFAPSNYVRVVFLESLVYWKISMYMYIHCAKLCNF